MHQSINYELNKVTAISAAAGIPGGFTMVGTIPADITQYMGHLLRIAQKLINDFIMVIFTFNYGA